MRYEVPTAMLYMIQDFWDVALCQWASVSQHSEGSLYLHHQGQSKNFLNCLILKMTALLSFKMLGTTSPTRCKSSTWWNGSQRILMNVVLPGILFILYFFNDNVQWIKNDVRSHSWGLISRYTSGIWLWRLRKDRRNLCQVSQCPNQDSKQPVLWLMWMETERLSVLQVQHTCVSNSSKQKDPVSIYVTQCSQ